MTGSIVWVPTSTHGLMKLVIDVSVALWFLPRTHPRSHSLKPGYNIFQHKYKCRRLWFSQNRTVFLTLYNPVRLNQFSFWDWWDRKTTILWTVGTPVVGLFRSIFQLAESKTSGNRSLRFFTLDCYRLRRKLFNCLEMDARQSNMNNKFCSRVEHIVSLSHPRWKFTQLWLSLAWKHLPEVPPKFPLKLQRTMKKSLSPCFNR